MKYFLYFFMILSVTKIEAQQGNKLSIEASYGLQGNFFVRSYEELGRPDGTAFLNKNFIGSIGGLEMSYQVTKMASISIGYAQSTNNRKINYFNSLNGVGVYITDFEIKHENRFYQLYYQRSLSRKINHFKLELGLYYLRSQQQEIGIGNNVAFEQRNFANSYLEEGGISAGFHYKIKVDTHFDFGIRSRIYYLISTNELEAISLTPTLTYRF
jgi:hypothetical protein